MEVHIHPAPSPLLHRALKSTLPYSMNLIYRTQHTNRTPHALTLATFPPSASKPPKCWAAAYLDRSMRPETELWIFAAGEIPNHSDPSASQFCPTCKTAVLSIIKYISTLPIPPLHADNRSKLEQAKQHEKEYPETGPHIRYPQTPTMYLRCLLMPSVLTLGACHESIVQILSSAGLIREEFPGRDLELTKFLFKISSLPETKELPKGLHWGPMRAQDIPVVLSRTSIPRTPRTLLSLKSVGVFETASDQPIAWTFLGLDGSLTTLHTEAGYRGKGIAKAVAARVFREYAAGLAVDGEGNAWAHADVYAGNVQSEGVCRSLGGEAFTKIFWVRIDVGRVGALAEAMEM